MAIGDSLVVHDLRRSVVLARGAVLALACAGAACGDGSEPDRWVSVRIAASCVDATGQNNCQPGAFLVDQQILPDLQRRQVSPKETVCGVLQANWDPGVTVSQPPDRLYHFRVLDSEARALIATGLYVDRASLNPNAPYTAIDCRIYALIP
jgi:hypothetical protein